MDENLDNRAEIGEKQIVVFRLETEEYGVDIHTIREIIRDSDMTEIPQTPHYVDGVLNLRGEITTIVSLRSILGMTRNDRTSSTRVLIMDLESKHVGVVVDEVTEVLRLNGEMILDADSIGTSDVVDNVDGIGKIGERLIILLALKKVLMGLNLEKKCLSELNDHAVA